LGVGLDEFVLDDTLTVGYGTTELAVGMLDPTLAPVLIGGLGPWCEDEGSSVGDDGLSVDGVSGLPVGVSTTVKVVLEPPSVMVYVLVSQCLQGWGAFPPTVTVTVAWAGQFSGTMGAGE
jgi:hypothetical protein